MSTAFGHIPIVNDGLTFYLDAYNEKSYVSGDTVTSNLVTNDFGKFDLSWVDIPYLTDEYNGLLFLSDRANPRQSIYNILTDTSYKFNSDSLGSNGGRFDTTEIINGLPVVYSCAGYYNNPSSPYFKRYEYQGNNTWTNTFTKNLTNRRHSCLGLDLYNSTNSRSDLWIGSSNNSSSTQQLTLHQWSGSDYIEYDFTSGVTPFLPKASKFVTSVTPVSNGRIFLQCFSYTNLSTNRQSSIVEMLYTGTTYTNVNHWSFTLIAGSNASGYGDTDGVLGVNTLAFITSIPSIVYKGDIFNGEPRLRFTNYWPSTWGNPSGSEFYIRELFWNGSAWEVTTHLTTIDAFFGGSINDAGDKFYLQNSTTDEVQHFDLNTSGLTTIATSIESSTEQERIPKTIDLINGVGFDDKSWTFDGIDDYIDGTPLLPTIQNDTQGTIECWVKYSSIVDNMTIFSIGRTSAVTGLSLRILSDSRIVATYEIGGVTQWNARCDFISNLNKWTQIVVTQDGVSPKFYLNGVDVTIFGGAGSQTVWLNSQSFNVFNIGRQQNSSGIGRYWGGDISNFKYYNRPLSAEEVLQNYNTTKWRFQ